ncbi:LacI family transcriptional regulator [Duganella sp. BJB488]|uniref:ABC transporter substrate-binding protein n=2 Tax=unclassified Duganella TaxID=2636909 RepID=UPI000E3521B4|nr:MULTISPECIES: substrate-binding domain-containing protein [unclassified Duganella]NVD73802.1 substrate-binding domain-containing protein [Duganella sp. BJB1802]RFP25852.1 LacI family transcriptional regulator [Duganella sp. BJB489]RFP28407.1 LacI family transcriptional regulator [Duganella sp. BJB488]RFP36782.1 LacI family transcriptional regulator [Duganella sp. BJB480]
MKKWMSLLLVCIAFSMWPAQAKDLNVVFIPKARDQDFWTFMRQGVERAMQEDGHVSLTWRGPAHNDDIDSQIQILRIYSRPEVDAIIIASTDRARLVEPVRQAAAMGIKVVVVDSAVDGNAQANFVTTDNYAAGARAAERLAKLLDRQGTVAVLRTIPGSGSTDDRANGFIDHLRKNAPRVAIVADEYGGGTRGKAARGAATLLEKYPQVDGIFAVNESTSDGMLRALRLTGLAGKKKFIGFDTTEFLLDGLRRQEIHGLVVQDPRQMGYQAMKAALAAAKGAPIKPALILTDAVMVTQENYLKPEIRSLLTP